MTKESGKVVQDPPPVQEIVMYVERWRNSRKTRGGATQTPSKLDSGWLLRQFRERRRSRQKKEETSHPVTSQTHLSILPQHSLSFVRFKRKQSHS